MESGGRGVIRLTNSPSIDVSPDWQRAPSEVPSSTVQFGAASYTVAEGAGSATVTVTRSGDVSGAASVDYQTVDDTAAVRCDDTVNNRGAAYARCDYATTLDTLTFAPGETMKTLYAAGDGADTAGGFSEARCLCRRIHTAAGVSRDLRLSLTSLMSMRCLIVTLCSGLRRPIRRTLREE